MERLYDEQPVTNDLNGGGVIQPSDARKRDIKGELGGVPVEVAHTALAKVQHPCDDLGNAGRTAISVYER